jgi:ABC-type uncharacterized transport system substrate-binding protein
MNRREALSSLAAGSLLATRFAHARLGAKVYRAGVLFAGSREPVMEVLRRKDWGLLQPLANLGYIDGRNLTFEWRFIEGNFKAPEMSVELVRLAPNLLFTDEDTPTEALQHATRTIPIVTAVNDPLESGFTRSLARPSGNILGICNRHPDTPAKQIDLLSRAVPGLERLVIIGDPSHGDAKQSLPSYEVAAKAAGIVPELRWIGNNGIERVFREMKASRMRAALIDSPDQPFAALAELAIRYGVATMLNDLRGGDPRAPGGYVERGGLMTFTMYHDQPFFRFASIFDKVFKGMAPAEIPWELPDRTHFAINLGTAKLLGLKIPESLLLRADKVVG